MSDIEEAIEEVQADLNSCRKQLFALEAEGLYGTEEHDELNRDMAELEAYLEDLKLHAQ